MTVLEALAILEAATLECKNREINTPEGREALDFLEPHIRPQWLSRGCLECVRKEHKAGMPGRSTIGIPAFTDCSIPCLHRPWFSTTGSSRLAYSNMVQAAWR